MTDQIEDARVFGTDAWIYCRAHLRAHKTGWCSVSPRNKIMLGVDNERDAVAKCRDWGLHLYGEPEPVAQTDPALLEAAQGVLRMLEYARTNVKQQLRRYLFGAPDHAAITRLRAAVKERKSQ